MKHLWEVDHAYYCNNGNYFANDCCKEWDSWEEFYDEFGDADLDYNLLFRWDWECKDKYNSENELYGDSEWIRKSDKLFIYWMGQRKGLYQISEVNVNKEDEPKVIEFLKPRMKYLFELWEPLYEVRNDPTP